MALAAAGKSRALTGHISSFYQAYTNTPDCPAHAPEGIQCNAYLAYKLFTQSIPLEVWIFGW
jgi:hypothetical protein